MYASLTYDLCTIQLRERSFLLNLPASSPPPPKKKDLPTKYLRIYLKGLKQRLIESTHLDSAMRMESATHMEPANLSEPEQMLIEEIYCRFSFTD